MSAITGYNPATVATLTSTTYRHVALSISGTVHSLYLDGSMVAQNLNGGNVFASYTSTIPNVFIGCAGDLSYGLTGSIDDFKIWNRALPPTDISAIYWTQFVPPFTPNLISGLILWLDAADAATFSGSTNSVIWSDKSGYGHNATNTTGGVGNYITRTTAPGASSYSTVAFRNNSTYKDQLISLKWTFTPTFVFPCTIFIVFDVAQLTGDYFLFLSNYFISSGGGGIMNTLQLYVDQNTSNKITIGQAGGGITTNSATYSLNRLNMVTMQIYKIGSTYYSINNLNGTINTTYSTYSGAATLLAQTWFIQMRGVNLSNIGISEYLIYNNNLLTQDQYQQVEGYLAQKWGLQTSLPAAHPYYTPP